MFDIIIERLRQKKRTVSYPKTLPTLLPRFRGRPFIDAERCSCLGNNFCDLCQKACPTGAISIEAKSPALDMGICTFCGACARACPNEALVFTTDWRLASSERTALIIRPAEYQGSDASPICQSLPYKPERKFLLPQLPVSPSLVLNSAFARSFRLRQVTAAGCGACEADLNVLSTVVFDLSRFGIDFVASPRHADALVLTGPVPRNMKEAFLKCLNAMPMPKLLIAVGACAISGGMFRAMPELSGNTGDNQRAEGVLPHSPADLFIPGCPPHPYTSLDGFLRLIGRKVPL